MSSNHRREERKKEIEVLRQQGLDAAVAGKSIHSIPREYINNANRQHWEEGYKSFVPEKPKPYQIQELKAEDFPDQMESNDGWNGIVSVPRMSAKNFEILVKKVNHIISFINVREYDRVNK